MDEETAVAILLGTIKTGDGKKNFLRAAQAVKHLRDSGYTYRKIAESIGVADSTIRQYDRVLRLPKKILPLLESGDLTVDKIDTIAAAPAEKREELAMAVLDLDAKDTRAILDYVKKHPEITPMNAKQRVLESKTVKEEIFMVVVPLSKSSFLSLKEESNKLGRSIDEVARIAIEDWLERT